MSKKLFKPDEGSGQRPNSSKKGSGKGTPMTGFRDARERAKHPITNEPAYYFKYPKLAELAAKLPFNHRNGAKLSFSTTGISDRRNMDPICIVPYLMTPGNSTGADSGINMASQAAWKMLNRRFRGVSKYQVPDFGIIQFGIVDFAVQVAEAERVYGILNYYSVNNLNMPDKLLFAMGYDPYSFTDLADYRLQLNRLLLRAKTLCLVRGYSLLDHFLFLSSNTFKDKNCDRAQLIVPVTQGYWKYTGTRFDTGSALEFIPHTISHMSGISYWPARTMQDILKDLQDQMEALLNDDDVDNVCSDILAFYGNKEDAAEIVKFASIPEEYMVKPIYSVEFLHQWHNSVLPPRVVSYTSLAENVDYYTDIEASITDSGSGNLFIYQINNTIRFNLHYVGSGTAVTRTNNGVVEHFAGTGSLGTFITRPILDVDLDSPSVQDIMEISRYTITENHETATIGGVSCSRRTINSFGTGIFLNNRIYLFKDPGEMPSFSSNIYTWTNVDVQSIQSTVAYNYAATKFDWAPITQVVSGTTIVVWGDTDNYITVGDSLLQPLHDVAVLSEFKNPITDLLLKED